MEEGPTDRIRSRRKVRGTARSLGEAIFIALFLRAFVVEAYVIPSGSMIPTLQVGDHLFVNKFLYGIHIPFTRIKLGASLRPPRRGEIVVFTQPRSGQVLIKRVVAVAGDRVAVRDGVPWIDGRADPSEPVDDRACRYHDYDEIAERWSVRECIAYREELGGARFTTLRDPGASRADFGPVTVPPGSVFVLGDNRDESYDSRYWGFVPLDLVKGRAMFVLWSVGQPEGLRLRRFFHPLE